MKYSSQFLAIAATLTLSCTHQVVVPTTAAAIVSPNYVPMEAYRQVQLEGWTLMVSKDMLKDPTWPKLEAKVRWQLLAIKQYVPPKLVDFMKTVKIFVEFKGGFKTVCYHHNRDWLVTNGYNLAKMQCVDIPDGRAMANHDDFIQIILFHELAHAYHNQVMGYENVKIKKLFEDMKSSGKYEKVLRINGNIERHYALTNVEEYFAESMEAYFFFNDYYPFNRAELRLVDPAFCRWLEDHLKDKSPLATPSP
jgi:hypothetical protein